MSYRDETEALRARVQKLEGDLEVAEARIEAMQREKAEHTTPEAPSAPTGTAIAITIASTLPFTISPDGYDAIAALLHDRLQLQASQVGQTLTAGRNQFALRVVDGRTFVRLRDHRPNPGAVFGAGIGLCFGVILAPVMVVLFEQTFLPLAFSAVPVCTIIGSALQHRTATTRASEAHAHAHAVMSAILEIAKAHAVERVVPATRVADGADRDQAGDELLAAKRRRSRE